MALTADNFAANLKTAKRIVAERLGLDPGNLTYEQRGTYNKAFAEYVSQFPASFSPELLEIARRVLAQKDYESLQAEGIKLGEFAEAYAGEVKTASAPGVKWIAGLVLAAAVLYLLFVVSLTRQNLK